MGQLLPDGAGGKNLQLTVSGGSLGGVGQAVAHVAATAGARAAGAPGLPLLSTSTSQPHSQLLLLCAGSVEAGFVSLGVGGRFSPPFPFNVSALVPSITSVQAAQLPTAGGQLITLTCFNFGPARNATAFARDPGYGVECVNPRGALFAAVDCAVTVAFSQLRCRSPPGVGSPLTWRVRARGVLSAGFLAAGSGYAAPVVGSVSVGAAPTTGVLPAPLQLTGSNFGAGAGAGAGGVVVAFTGPYGTHEAVGGLHGR